MMHSNIPKIVSCRPTPNKFNATIDEAMYDTFFPADLINHPDEYEAEFEVFFRRTPEAQAIWETGQGDNGEALNALNTAIINTACARLRNKASVI